MRRVPENRLINDVTFFVTTRLNTTQTTLNDEDAAQLTLDTLSFYRQRHEVEIYGFVVMPDHVHLVVKILPPVTLPRWMNRFKSYIARQLGKGPIWQKGYWSEVIPSMKFLEQKLNYIHANPVRAGLVEEIEDYPWSSAQDYYGEATSDRIDNY